MSDYAYCKAAANMPLCADLDGNPATIDYTDPDIEDSEELEPGGATSAWEHHYGV